MKGRKILWETQGSSIYALCPYRLGEAQTKAVRRFLQTSRATSRPPAAAAAALIEEDNSARHYDEFAISKGRRPFLPGEETLIWRSRKWSQPAFGNGGFARNGPAIGSANNELTEEERRAKDLITQIEQVPQQRLVHIYSGPGPSSTRAGRPVPRLESDISIAKLAAQASIRTRQKAMDAAERRHITRRNESGLRTGNPDRFRIIRHVPSRRDWQPSVSQIGRPDISLSSRESNWSQLKRTKEPPIPVGSHQDNSFVQDRARREEISKFAQYTPLGSQRGSGAWQRVVRDSKNEQSPHLKSNIFSNGDTERTAVSEMIVRPAEILNAKSISTDLPINPGESSGRGKYSKQQQGGFVENSFDKENRCAEDLKRQSQRPDTNWRKIDRDKRKRREAFVQNFDDDELENSYDKDKRAKERKREKAAKKAAKRPQAPTPLLLPEYISVANLASVLRVRTDDFMRKLEQLGFEAMSYDHILNGEHAALIAMEYNFEPVVDGGESEDLKAQPVPKDKSHLSERPPVVTIMGHVDHGKTTLLDWLRKSSVAATEYGGITQHIGAFSVSMPSGKIITFLDTPGHAAFLSMRQRGANVTDIVILVVAADDSVKPQTIEAINHAKAAKVPMIVAINKIDKEEASIERVKHDLARHGVEIEDFGGDTQVVCVSGKTGQGMIELEEAAITLSEVLDLRAQRDGPAEGWILEAGIKSLGKVATVLVRRGTIRAGDVIVAGKTWARIRCLRNEAGVELSKAGPGTPVQIDGWKELPLAGQEVLQAPTESKAKGVVHYRRNRGEREKLADDIKSINELRRIEHETRDREIPEALSVSQTEQPAGPKQVHFIVKGDVSGSVEAVVDSITSIGNKEVQPHVLRSGTGQITEFDVEHAAAANGYLINFNSAIDSNIFRLAESSKVKILDHNIIYRLVHDVKETLSAYLPPLLTQRVLGEADIVQIFDITIKRREHKAIAGCKIRNGIISLHSKARVLRNGVTIFDGCLASLKNVKKDVLEMRKGNECGMGFEGWDGFQVGDQVQSYETKEEKRYM